MPAIRDKKLANAELQIRDVSSSGFNGVAKPGATIEAINLTTAPTGRFHPDDTMVIGKADGFGRFTGSFDDRLGATQEGDVVRFRARHTDGTTSNWLTIRVKGLEAEDTRNAEIALFRIDLTYDTGTGKVLVANNNPSRQISEPGAKVQLTNERTGQQTAVTLNDEGTFAGDLEVDGKPGDVFVIAVSDGVNNKRFNEVAGTLAVPVDTRPDGAVDLPDPGLVRDDLRADGTPKYKLVRFNGPVFKDGPSPEDVLQGNIGDCYFPAAVAAVAQANPKAIENMIEQLPDKTYVVTFKERDWSTGRVSTVRQHIDGDLWARNWGGPLYGASAGSTDPDKMEMWWPLIEKAYASWMDSYEEIGHGGGASDIMEAMLGLKGYTSSISASRADQVWGEITKAVDEKRPCAMGTHGTSKRSLYTNTGVYPDHAYSILGYKAGSNGERLVTIRNPWGESEPAGNGPNDGIFDMKLEEVCRLYATFYSVRG